MSINENGVSSCHQWRDDGWMQFRKKQKSLSDKAFPINIYSVCLESWQHRDDGSRFSFSELASELACYVKQMGYTHVELLAERTSSFFSSEVPGERETRFSCFVDALHEAGVGVILQKKSHLSDKEGALSPRHVEQYHVDGIDLLGDECQNAASAEHLSVDCANLLLLGAQNRNDKIETPFSKTLFDILCEQPIFRKYRMPKLLEESKKTQGADLVTFFSDGCCLEKMWGDSRQRIASVKAAFGCMMTVPGVKRTLMGNEIGCFPQALENVFWEADRLSDPFWAELQLFFAKMNHLYLSFPILQNGDVESCEFSETGYEAGVLSYCRSSAGEEPLYVVVNFTSDVQKNHEILVASPGEYTELINSDDTAFGGGGITNGDSVCSQDVKDRQAIKITVPPLALCVFQRKKSVPKTH